MTKLSAGDPGGFNSVSLAKLKVGYNCSENEMKSLNIKLLQTLLVKKQNLNEQMKWTFE